ncbi:unnamed protein product [Paramecium pentaurelia]|uniref:Uncharacterized protein n=1 Tax=Paramecium pentaurelia TaxID=43138 RepID=A0A8S1W280_9CILI|nr:unnamed protein product [Paramecium pentaurelia]
MLIKAIKNYCILANNLLLKCKQDKELQLITFCQQILKLTSEEQQQINVTYLQEFQFKPIMLEENEQIRDNESYIKNLITFDQYLIIQQESTISILTKRVANEKLICDILRNSTTANYSGLLLDHQLVIQYINQQSIEEQQKFSDYQSENISSYLLSVFMTKQQKLKLLKGSQTYYQLI